MKKVLLFILFISAVIVGCKKYDAVLTENPIPPPPIPYHPDNTWIGNDNFYVKGNGNTMMLIFHNDVSLSGSPFFEYRIGIGSWSAPIVQSVPFDGQADWGSGNVPVSAVIPEDAIINIRFGVGSTYADTHLSMFYVNGVISFGLPQIEQ